MAKNPPAFQFYANDFVSGTSRMTTTEVGGYILLLCEQWEQGSVPGDEPKRLAAIMRCTPAAARAIWNVVRSKFVKMLDGRWQNQRLEEVRAEQSAFSERQRANGSKGGRPRTGNPEETHSKPKQEPTTNPEESSPISDLHKDESKNDSSGPIPRDLLAVHQRLFIAKYGRKPAYDGKKDAAIAKRLLSAHGLDEATRLIEAFFQTSDAWITDKGHSFGLLAMAGIQNKLSAEISRRRPIAKPSLISPEDEKTKRYIDEINARPVMPWPLKKAGA